MLFFLYLISFSSHLSVCQCQRLGPNTATTTFKDPSPSAQPPRTCAMRSNLWLTPATTRCGRSGTRWTWHSTRGPRRQLMPATGFRLTSPRLETSKTEVWLFGFLINQILPDDSFFLLFLALLESDSYFEVFLISFS